MLPPAAGVGWCQQQIQPCHWRNPTRLVALCGDLLGHFLLGGAQQGMSGDVDYLLKIAVADIAHYDRIYQELIAAVPGLSDVSSTFSMERLKYGTALAI